MTSRANQALESFKELCDNILAGTVDQENMRTATKAMNDTESYDHVDTDYGDKGD